MASAVTTQPWWRDMRPEAVVERAKLLPENELRALMSEVKAACGSMSLRWQDKTLSDDERHSAKRALEWTVQKKRLLAALIARTLSDTEGYDHRHGRVEAMLEAAEEAEDPHEAIRLLAATLRAMWKME
jgi:hypothetical protein